MSTHSEKTNKCTISKKQKKKGGDTDPCKK